MNRLYPLSSYTKEVNYLIASGTNMMKPSTATTTESLPFEYKIIGSYPNPFNPETTIRYSLGGESDVDVEIFDINGTRVLNGKETVNKQVFTTTNGMHQQMPVVYIL
jgi:hypothetical protein